MPLDSIRGGLGVQGQLVRDTFRQARASGISVMMLAITAICCAFCLSLSISGDVPLHDPDEAVYFLPGDSRGLETSPRAQSAKPAAPASPEARPGLRDGVETLRGRMRLGFGAIELAVSRERRDSVRFLELLLGGGMAGTLGLLLVLVWTSGFVPGFLEPAVASVMLAKPISRRRLLIGKYLGVLAFVFVHMLLFVAATWTAIGLRTGVWDLTYWLCIPLLLVQFASFYSLSVLISVVTRSTVASVFGSLICWLLAWGINCGDAMLSAPGVGGHLPASTAGLSHAAYWIAPKPVDMGLILFNTLGAEKDFEKPVVFRSLEAGDYSPASAIGSSIALAVLVLAAAACELESTDY